VSTQKAKKGNSHEAEKFLENLGKFFLIVFQVVIEGIKRANWKCPITVGLFTIIYSIVFFVLGYRLTFVDFLRWLDLGIFTPFKLQRFAGLGELIHGLLLMFLYWFSALFCYGLRPYREKRKIEKGLQDLNIKSGLNCRPKLIDLQKLGPCKTKIVLLSRGVGIEHYENRIRDMESCFDQLVESIKIGSSPKYVEIMLTSKVLPKTCHFKEMVQKVQKPYSFVIGESLSGTMVKSIMTIPGGHLLVAGTTGGGKSNWFKATLLSLLDSSPHAQFFLLDFKGGVEFAPFGKFPNVQVEKDMEGAIRVLRLVRAEMSRRHLLNR